MKLYLLLFIFILLVIFFSLNYNIDYFNNDIIFLKGSELYNIIKSNTEYYNKFSPSDMKVRNINNINEYIDKIKEAPIDINDNIKDKLTRCINNANNKLQSINIKGFNGVKASNIGWKIGLVSGDIYEGGLPHTVKDTIILNIKNTNYDDNILTRLLIHEMVHIYQKKYADDIKLYLEYNDFKIVKYRNNVDNIRANPDIDRNIYMKNGMEYKLVYNNNPTSIIDTVTSDQNYEHPFEQMAINISNN